MTKLRKFNLNLKVTSELLMVGFFFTLSVSIIVAMLSPYLQEAYNLNKSSIGLLLIVFNVSSIIFSSTISTVIEKFHEKKLLVISIISLILLYVAMYFNESLIVFVVLFILVELFVTFKNSTFNILYRDNSDDGELIKNQCLWGSFRNLAYVISPILIGYFLYNFPTKIVFLLSAFFYMGGIFLYLNLDIKEEKREEENEVKNNNNDFFKNIKTFFTNRFYLKAFIVSSGINIWWGFIYTFLTLMILDQGFNKSSLGIIIALINLPLVFFEIIVYKFVTKFGFKNTFFSGYFILAICGFLAFLVNDFKLKIAFIVIGSIGAALIEPTKDSFFFTNTSKKNEEKFYSLFTTNIYFGSIFSKLIFSIFFFFVNDANWAFLLVSIIMGLILIPVLKIKSKEAEFDTSS